MMRLSRSPTKSTHQEIRTQRERIGEVRDLQTRWTKEDLICVVDYNNPLKRQVRQHTSENKDLKSELAAPSACASGLRGYRSFYTDLC
jgi:hypothetical protein